MDVGINCTIARGRVSDWRAVKIVCWIEKSSVGDRESWFLWTLQSTQAFHALWYVEDVEERSAASKYLTTPSGRPLASYLLLITAKSRYNRKGTRSPYLQNGVCLLRGYQVFLENWHFFLASYYIFLFHSDWKQRQTSKPSSCIHGWAPNKVTLYYYLN